VKAEEKAGVEVDAENPTPAITSPAAAGKKKTKTQAVKKRGGSRPHSTHHSENYHTTHHSRPNERQHQKKTKKGDDRKEATELCKTNAQKAGFR